MTGGSSRLGRRRRDERDSSSSSGSRPPVTRPRTQAPSNTASAATSRSGHPAASSSTARSSTPHPGAYGESHTTRGQTHTLQQAVPQPLHPPPPVDRTTWQPARLPDALGPRPGQMPVYVGQVRDPSWIGRQDDPDAELLRAFVPANTNPRLLYTQNFIESLTLEQWRMLIALSMTCKIRMHGHAEQVTYNIPEAARVWVFPRPGDGDWTRRFYRLMDQPMKHGWIILAMALYRINVPDVDLHPARSRLLNVEDCQTPLRNATMDFRNPLRRTEIANAEWAASWIQWKLRFGGGVWEGPAEDRYWWAGKHSPDDDYSAAWNTIAGAQMLWDLWFHYELEIRRRFSEELPGFWHP